VVTGAWNTNQLSSVFGSGSEMAPFGIDRVSTSCDHVKPSSSDQRNAISAVMSCRVSATPMFWFQNT
jgi:hypothetical protein